jgi:plastocyanin
MRALAIAFLLLAVVVAGCSGSSEDGFTEPPKDAEGRYVIQLTTANAMVPAKAKVPAGAAVVWQVAPGGFHDVTSEPGAPESFTSDSEFPSKMREGDKYGRTFAKAGDYPYRCAVHGAMMQGILRVA